MNNYDALLGEVYQHTHDPSEIVPAAPSGGLSEAEVTALIVAALEDYLLLTGGTLTGQTIFDPTGTTTASIFRAGSTGSADIIKIQDHDGANDLAVIKSTGAGLFSNGDSNTAGIGFKNHPKMGFSVTNGQWFGGYFNDGSQMMYSDVTYTALFPYRLMLGASQKNALQDNGTELQIGAGWSTVRFNAKIFGIVQPGTGGLADMALFFRDTGTVASGFGGYFHGGGNMSDNGNFHEYWRDEFFLTSGITVATKTTARVYKLTDYSGEREYYRVDADGTQILMGWFGVTPVARQTELTDELTTVTFTAPGTPDYAIQDLTNAGGFGFVTKDEGNTVLSVIANLQTRINELETKLTAYGLLIDAD